MKKRDLSIIIITVFASVAIFFAVSGSDNDTVIVSVGGETVGEYSLSEDRTIDINGTNTLVIRDGKAYMQSASCPDKLCIKQGAIDKNGGSIICLPNKVAVEANGGADAVSR